MMDNGEFAIRLFDFQLCCCGLNVQGIVICCVDDHGDGIVVIGGFICYVRVKKSRDLILLSWNLSPA